MSGYGFCAAAPAPVSLPLGLAPQPRRCRRVQSLRVGQTRPLRLKVKKWILQAEGFSSLEQAEAERVDICGLGPLITVDPLYVMGLLVTRRQAFFFSAHVVDYASLSPFLVRRCLQNVDPCDEIGNCVSHVISSVATGVKTRLGALA